MIVVMIMIVTMAAIVVPVIVMVPVVIPVPVVVVLNPAAVSRPVTHEILSALVVRRHPVGPFIRWPSPVARMPLVMPPDRIPIPTHKNEFRSRRRRLNINRARWRWRADRDADGNLRASRGNTGEDDCCKQRSFQQIPHMFWPSSDLPFTLARRKDFAHWGFPVGCPNANCPGGRDSGQA